MRFSVNSPYTIIVCDSQIIHTLLDEWMVMILPLWLLIHQNSSFPHSLSSYEVSVYHLRWGYNPDSSGVWCVRTNGYLWEWSICIIGCPDISIKYFSLCHLSCEMNPSRVNTVGVKLHSIRRVPHAITVRSVSIRSMWMGIFLEIVSRRVMDSWNRSE